MKVAVKIPCNMDLYMYRVKSKNRESEHFTKRDMTLYKLYVGHPVKSKTIRSI